MLIHMKSDVNTQRCR